MTERGTRKIMISRIEERLNKHLSLVHLEIADDSARHADHASNPYGGGHYTAVIVSEDFRDLPLLKRHRLVYDALVDLMGGPIHAFSMKTLTPEEFGGE